MPVASTHDLNSSAESDQITPLPERITGFFACDNTSMAAAT